MTRQGSRARELGSEYAAGVVDSPALKLTQLEGIARGFPDVQLVALFGSLARGQALRTSDADFAVLGGSFWQGLSLGAALGSALGREPHVVELETASDLLRMQVARDGKLVFEREPGLWVRFRAESVVRWMDVAPMVELCAAGVRKRLQQEARRG